MPTPTLTQQSPPRAVPEPEQRFVLTGISWDAYESFLKELSDRPSLRLTYDRGVLEFMTISHEHESYKKLLGRLIEILILELRLPAKCAGSTTLRRRLKKRGLEPDECYYLRNEPRVRGKKALDFAADPAPDLALEIDVSHSSVKRMGIYAALGVSEVWRFDGSALSVHLLQPDRKYVESKTSLCFPFLPMNEFAPFLHPDPAKGETEFLCSYQDWVRTRLVPLARGAANP